jgi:NAD(P)-dependent dehydrogenase (short-subunit alcohol dehydrogenase family)
MNSWRADDLGDLHGKTVVITGANSGIGFEAARMLAIHGATVVLACRDDDRAASAKARIADAAPDADISTVRLDLASLKSVHAAAAEIGDRQIDVLINNAGLMMPPHGTTEDGFELQFGTNHLGHFAFTGLLLDRLWHGRIVTVSSAGHRMGDVDFDNLQWERRYSRMRSYGRSKLANLLFTYELQHRLADSGADAIAVGAHPGTAMTELQRHLPLVMRFGTHFIPHQPAALGALPMLRAGFDPAVSGGQYYGPDGRFEFAGHPVLVKSSPRSHDRELQRRLWEVSTELTGVTYPFALASRST